MPKRYTSLVQNRSLLTAAKPFAKSVNDATDETVDAWFTFSPENISFDDVTGIATIDSGQDGVYEVSYTVVFVANATGDRRCFISINNDDTVKYGGRSMTGNSEPTTLTGSCIVTLAATDTVRLRVYQTSGAALNLGGAGDLRCFISIDQLS
jgi:hypothetical protein